MSVIVKLTLPETISTLVRVGRRVCGGGVGRACFVGHAVVQGDAHFRRIFKAQGLLRRTEDGRIEFSRSGQNPVRLFGLRNFGCDRNGRYNLGRRCILCESC